MFSAPFPLLSPDTWVSIDKNVQYHRNSSQRILEPFSKQKNELSNNWKILKHCLILLSSRPCTPRFWGSSKSARMKVKLESSSCCFIQRAWYSIRANWISCTWFALYSSVLAVTHLCCVRKSLKIDWYFQYFYRNSLVCNFPLSSPPLFYFKLRNLSQPSHV